MQSRDLGRHFRFDEPRGASTARGVAASWPFDGFLELKRGVLSTAAGISLLERVADVAKLLAERQRLVAIER